jgi:hypothetical protein
MQAQAAFLKGIKVRWLHVRSIGKLWWIVLAVVWGVFWSADQTIAKWGSPSLKLFWNTYTLHSPIDWKIGIIVLLVILYKRRSKNRPHYAAGAA